jgi:catechol 2,3-dioxygenase
MVIRLAHIEVGVSDLERAREFYVGVLGFVEAQRTADALHLRASHDFDVWSLKLTRAEGPGMFSMGLRVSDPSELESLANLHERLGLQHVALPAGFEPGRGEGLRVQTASGHVVDFHHEIDEIAVYGDDGVPSLPMRRPGALVGVPPLTLDHVNLRVLDLTESVAYWADKELGFSVSEQANDANGRIWRAWMRRRRQTHEIALGEHEHAGMHHFAYTVSDATSLIRTSDLLADAGYAERQELVVGRHGATNALTMYFLDPDGNRIELFANDYRRDLDRPTIVWDFESYLARGALAWGHPNFKQPEVKPLLDVPWPVATTAGS